MIDGRYSFAREIGRGGTGAVWLGRDEVLGRSVALKRIGVLPGDDHTNLARAEREAHLSAQINHPHVVAVFDLVIDPDTHDRWLVMEYVDGLTLGQLVQDHGPLSPDEAAPLLRQVCEALAAAHAAGVAHRDVKPSNVLVDGDGTAKLTDFGIARVETDPSLTQTGMMTGSPSYLAPEVASGGRGGLAADVWSLGATAFHVLAGRPPYEITDNVLGALYRIVHDEPPRLADAGWMAPLLTGTMIKDPDQRWSIDEVRTFLTRPDHPAPAAAALDRGEPEGENETRVLTNVPAPPTAAPPVHARPGPPGVKVLVGLVVLALLLTLALVAALVRDGSDGGPTASGTRAGADPAAAERPTAEGMESFIHDYVAIVAVDPDAAWQMLTPKFQRESGGIDRYRAFWDSATNGKVRDITADPETLSVSYHVHFDDFDNGPGPTVLDLRFKDGRYLIDGERTKGFVPAG